MKILFLLLWYLTYAVLPVFLLNITTSTPHYCMWGERVNDIDECPKMLNYTSEHIANRMEYAEKQKSQRPCYRKKEFHHEQMDADKDKKKSIFGIPQANKYTPKVSNCEIQLQGWVAASRFIYHAQIIDYKNGGFCGGNAISPHFLVTAAHCVYGETNSSNFHVLLGDNHRGEGVYVDVSRIEIHDGFLKDDNGTESNFAYDLALLYTQFPIPCLWTIPLADQKEQIGTYGKVYGFGAFNNNTDGSQYPDKLLYADDLEILESPFPNMPTVFTSSGKMGKGDSGAPFVWKENEREVLGGIHTRNVITAKNNKKMSQYLRIVDFKDWIHKTMEKILNEEIQSC